MRADFNKVTTKTKLYRNCDREFANSLALQDHPTGSRITMSEPIRNVKAVPGVYGWIIELEIPQARKSPSKRTRNVSRKVNP